MERKFPLREDSNRLRIAPPAEGRFPEPEIPIGNRTSPEPLSPTNNTNTCGLRKIEPALRVLFRSS